jgi:hypothetical protein
LTHIDELIRSVGATDPVGDRVEDESIDAARRVLRAAILAELALPGARSRRTRLIALFAVLALAGLTLPAYRAATEWFGANSEIAGIRGDEAPRLSGAPVVLASGEPEEPWTIFVARSNQGLCLNVDVGDEEFRPGRYRLGDCGFSDIRGELPPDVRGNPSAPCIGLSVLVRCGSLPRYAVAFAGNGRFFGPRFRHGIFAGAAAADVASVELLLANGDAVQAQVVKRPLGPDVPLNVYWTELGPEQGLAACLWHDREGRVVGADSGEFVKEVVSRDADGSVLGRRLPAWNGNPTGDPHGARPPIQLGRDPCAA